MSSSSPAPKKFLNDPSNAVEEFIHGLLLQYPNQLVKLQNHNVVLSAHLKQQSQVHILSGGGSGHEPSHAGWIGSGMLSGAICGGIFASPSVASILAAIRVANVDNKGVLLVVKNYTGDRLNFGMACETANMEGIPCQMVVVADDCALERTKGITGARGVAGTVLVHKVAGAAAAQGKSLDEVVQLANLVARRTGTLGVALDSVTVPGAATVNDRLDDKTIEIGLGIHGEAGMKQSPLLSANELAQEMIDTIVKYGRTDDSDAIVPFFQSGDELLVLVNNLGGTSNFELSILANSCITALEKQSCKITRVLVGSCMTSFDMHGASLTIVNLTGASPELVQLLDADTQAPAWNACDVWDAASGSPRPSLVEMEEKAVAETSASISLPPVDMDDFESKSKSMIEKSAQSLIEQEPLLTKYDTIVGDGDCGITMKRGASHVLEQVQNGTLKTEHPVTLMAGIADSVSASMGGTSGVLLEIMFRKMSSTLSRCEKIGVSELCQAFQSGVDAVSFYGGAQVGSRTMLDALVPSAAALVSTLSLEESAAKAQEGADSTAAMKSASAGRSNYLSEETLAGTPDPGAAAVAFVLQALAS